MNPQQQQPPQQPTFDKPEKADDIDTSLLVMAKGEQVVSHIKRHWFGLIGPYFISGILLVFIFAGAALAPHYIPTLSAHDKNLIFALAIVLAVMDLLFLYVAIIVYNGNRWILTNDSLTQINQVSLFSKQSSQLSVINIEDVTAVQGSFLQTIFNFGTVQIQTAAEQEKFIFQYCPEPSKYARIIIQVHEEFVAQHGAE